MEKIRTLRGFRDIIGDEVKKFNLIEGISRRYLSLLGFREIEVPVLEKTELFVRSIGDTTDIVEKEMFSFVDLGGDSVTLRPEATAGMTRAYLQEALYTKERVSKLFTVGSMFRHEKPQKGRFREFRQLDIETFGSDDPMIDAELLWLISLILKELHVFAYTIEVNSVGCGECRESFRDILVSHFEERKGELCEDCLRRLQKNPLRIFDCKVERCIAVAHDSPLLFDSLCQGCRTHFDTFLGYVDAFGVPVVINKRLVRGLDYYTKTVFEVTSDELGAQKAFTAGGRYNNLVEEMGGPSTPAIGFAVGMERLAMLTAVDDLPRSLLYFFAYVGERAKQYLVPLKRSFIARGLPLACAYEGKSLKSQMRYADSLGADYVLILGDNEIEKEIITIRDMRSKAQYELPLNPDALPEEMLKTVPGCQQPL